LPLAEDLNLRLIDIVREAGTWFAVPSQTIKIEKAEEFDGQRRAEVEEIVSQWRKTDQLPFPELSDVEIEKLEDSLDYPPLGSPQAKKP
ncbi:MAG: mechanosensitive ion channel family protein, partial [Deltaproteobacteria bacterium]|nr:mechanosensitive ion channel family protein [Deltaproteobacteria bacterium]